jgi:hypothetical protein
MRRYLHCSLSRVKFVQRALLSLFTPFAHLNFGLSWFLLGLIAVGIWHLCLVDRFLYLTCQVHQFAVWILRFISKSTSLFGIPKASKFTNSLTTSKFFSPKATVRPAVRRRKLSYFQPQSCILFFVR